MLETRQLNPEVVDRADAKTLKSTFVFSKPATGFVFVPPLDRGAVKLIGIETAVYHHGPVSESVRKNTPLPPERDRR